MQKVLLIVGPTASGKTSFAVSEAKNRGGEVISADSMQIYTDMSIASATPSEAEMCGIPHHLMNFLSPEEPFSVAKYVELAHKKILEISAKNKLPIVCGGTGLYVNSLIFGTNFDTPEKWETPVFDIELIYLSPLRFELYEKINQRVDNMIAMGLVEEAQNFFAKYPSAPNASFAIGHKELKPYIVGESSLDLCVENLKQKTRNYAKRQYTWFNKTTAILEKNFI